MMHREVHQRRTKSCGTSRRASSLDTKASQQASRRMTYQQSERPLRKDVELLVPSAIWPTTDNRCLVPPIDCPIRLSRAPFRKLAPAFRDRPPTWPLL